MNLKKKNFLTSSHSKHPKIYDKSIPLRTIKPLASLHFFAIFVKRSSSLPNGTLSQTKEKNTATQCIFDYFIAVVL